MRNSYTNQAKTASVTVRICLSVLLTLLLSLSAADQAHAQCSTCNFSITTNSNASIPAGQTYCIAKANYTGTVTFANGSTLCIPATYAWNSASFTFSGATGTINNYGTSNRTITLPSGYTFNNYGTYTGTLTQNAGSTVNNSGTFGGTLTQNGGVFNNTSTGTISGSSTIKGTLTNDGAINNAVTVAAGGQFTNNGTLSAPLSINAATANVDNFGTISGTFTQSAGTIENQSGGTFSPSGTPTYTAGTFNNMTGGTVTLGSTTIKNGYTFNNYGAITTTTLVINAGGVMNFAGTSQTVNGSVTNNNLIYLNGTLTITGNYTDGLVTTAIRATGSGDNCNILSIGGTIANSIVNLGLFDGNNVGMTLTGTVPPALRMVNGATGPVAAPAVQGTSLSISASALNVSGSFTSPAATNGHLVLRYIGTSPVADVPASNVKYTVGDIIGSSTVEAITTGGASAKNFSDVLPASACGQNVYYTVFSFNGTQPCEIFNLSSPLSSSITMTVPTATVTAGGPTTFCAGGSVLLTAGGGGSYLWSTASAATSISATTSGTYTVTVTAANGCTASDNDVVTVNSAAAITPYYNINGGAWVNSAAPSLCAGASLQFGSQPLTAGTWYTTGPSGYVSYARDTIITNIQAAQAGTYAVTYTDAGNGCSSSANYNVTVNALPTPTANSASICAGQSATLTATGGTSYLWSTGTSGTSITVSPAGTTTYTVTATNAAGCTATASGTVTIKPLPAAAITAGGPTTFCTPGSVALTASGGGTYLWSTTATTANILTSTTGTYTVTVTHAINGCTATASRAVTANATPAPTITPSGATGFCTGGSVTLTAGGGGTYLWSTTAATAAISVNTTGTYTVTVTGAAGGCTATASQSVTVNALPVATIAGTSPNTFCAGTIDTLTASGGVSYAWSTTATTASVSVTTSGTYSVTVTNASGCTATASRVITVNANPTPSSTSAVSCFGASKTITASGGVSYLWSTGATTAAMTPSPMPASTTIYTVTATNAAGCKATANGTITIDNPSPTTNNPAVCAGGTATMTAMGGGTYLWSTGSTTDTIRSQTAGVYNVTVTDVLGCSATVSGIITVNALPTPSVNSQAICAGDTATLTATGGSIYTWSTTQTGTTIRPTTAGTYTVTATNIGSCTATASGTVTIAANPVATATNGVICSGSPATITASGGIGYLWSNTAATASTTVVSTGTYTVTVTNAAGCKATASSTVTTGTNPTASVTSPSMCAGKTATPVASGGTSYLWSTTAATASITVSPASTTAYTVTVSNASGCSANLTSTVTVNANPTAAATGGVICTGGTTTPATLVASGGISYLWSGGTSTNTASNPVNTVGTYTVTVTNAAGCTATASAAATTAAKTIPVVTTSSTGVCNGNSITITATAAGVTYLWSGTGATTNAITVAPTTTTTYTVTVTNAATCTASAGGTATIFLLPATAPNSNSPILLAGTINLTSGASGGTAGYTYSWSGPSSYTSTTTNPSITGATPAKGGIYYLTVTDSKGCTATGNTTVILNYASPGGLTSNTALWLYGDSVIRSGSNVTGWFDASQLNNDVTAINGIAPTWTASGVNYHPAVNFAGTGGLVGAFNTSITSNEATAFVVMKANTTSTTSSGIFSIAGTGLVDSTNVSSAAFFARGTNSIYTQRNNAILGNYTNASAINQYHMATSLFSSTASRDSFFIEGRAQTTATAASGSFAATRYAVGQRIGAASSYGKYFNGQIAEVALFNRQVTIAERAQVESYLALKYGFTLDQTTAQNYVASNGTIYWNAAANGTYKNNIFGVGIDNVCALNQAQSVSINNSVLSINSASALTFYSFLLVADNAGTNTVTNTTGLPNNINAKIATTWRVSQVGTRTPANYVFDKSFTNFGVYASVSSALTAYMLIDSDANGTYESYASGTPSGSTIAFNANLRNGCLFTFGFKGNFDFGDAPGVATLTASNGPSHLIVPGVYLGALIDAELDGQVSVNSTGDDATGVADEDGVEFNAGISTAYNIVSMGSNTIRVTASTAGYLNAWADFDQDNSYGGGSEYAIKNVPLVAGVNNVVFNVSDSVQYGKTSMRFRFATGSTDVTAATGLATNGEVEDYQIYVTAPLVGGCTNGFQNPDFEMGPAPGSYIITDQTNLPYWRTTAPDKQVEMWNNGFNGVNAYSGQYFMELEANQLGALYQDVYTTPGATVLWSFAHRGRSGVDSCNLKIGPPGSTITIKTVGDGTSGWGVYNGTYIVPAGQYITRFEFNALYCASGDLSVGNFLDKVSVSSSFDYGDAPDSYGTLKASNGPYHALSSTLYLGAGESCDLEGAPGVAANGDAMDDGITFPTVCANCNTYTVSISAYNNTGKTATIAGWIDFNKNGIFETAERKSINIPSSASNQTVSITFTVTTFSSTSAGTYARFRIASDSTELATPNGLARTGEVEDYKVPCVAVPTPVPTAPTPVCARGPMALTASGSAPFYSWTGPNGYSASVQNPTVASVGAADSGSYRVYAVYANGCVTDSAVKVVVSNCFVSLSGFMLDDANGNGTKEPAEVYTNNGQTFYAVLVSSGNTVLDKSTAAAGGTFTFASVPAYTTGMKIIPSLTNPAIGAAAPAAAWPTNWVGTKNQYGINNNSGTGLYATASQIPVSVDIKNVTAVSMGYDRLPTSTVKNYTISRPHLNSTRTITPANGLGMFGGTDPEDGTYAAGSTFTITSLSGLNGNKLFYDANGDGTLQAYEEITGYTVITNVDPTKFTIKFSGNAATTTSFTYGSTDAAGQVDPAPATYTITWTGALPVKLISFTADKYNQTAAQLRWSTASEVNNDKFEIERSADGTSWEKIGEVKGNGTTNEQIDYTMVDESPMMGVNYYRLKQIDFDGKFEYSDIVQVEFDTERQPHTASTLNIYPNPLTAGHGLNIALKGDDNIKHIVITNEVGQTVYNNDVQDIQDYEIQGLDLPAGIYIVSIVSQNNTKLSGKIMVTK